MVTQVVHYVLDTPYAIDYDAIQDAVRAAGYELTSLRLDTHGTVSSQRCDTCAADVPVVKLPGTGQIIELRMAARNRGQIEIGDLRDCRKVLIARDLAEADKTEGNLALRGRRTANRRRRKSVFQPGHPQSPLLFIRYICFITGTASARKFDEARCRQRTYRGSDDGSQESAWGAIRRI